ncbi:MAG: TolC family protein [Cytophagales bacterium]|nr:TolC family protein [Cytophagales bacterium]
MKKLLLAIITLAITTSVLKAQNISLKECVEMAIKNHPDYQGAVLNAEIAEANFSASKSNRLPNMQVEVYQSTNTGRSIDRFTNAYINQIYSSTYAQASLSQPIFQGFRMKHDIRSKELRVSSELHNIEAMKNDLTIRIIQAYLNVLQAEELLVVAKSQVASSAQQLDRVTKQTEAGVLGKSELLQMRTQYSNDEFAKINAEGNLKQAKLALFQLLNISPDNDYSFERLPENMASQDFKEVSMERVFENLPEIKAADAQIKSFESQAKSIKAENLPSLNFFADWNTFYASSNSQEMFFEQINSTRNGSVTLGLQIPIFGRLQTSPRVQAAMIQKKVAQNQLRSSKLSIQQSYYTSLQNYDIAYEQFKNAEEQVKVNNENLEAVQAQINAGTVNAIEYILAKTNYDRAKANLVQAKYSFLLQEKVLEFFKTGVWSLN